MFNSKIVITIHFSFLNNPFIKDFEYKGTCNEYYDYVTFVLQYYGSYNMYFRKMFEKSSRRIFLINKDGEVINPLCLKDTYTGNSNNYLEIQIPGFPFSELRGFPHHPPHVGKLHLNYSLPKPLQLQSGDPMCYFSTFKKEIQDICSSSILKVASADAEFMFKVLEDFLILLYSLSRSDSMSDITVSFINYAKLNTTGSLVLNKYVKKLISYFSSLFDEPELQAGTLKDLRKILDHYDMVKESKFAEKIYRFSMYCLSYSVFSKIGLDFDFANYSKMESEAIKSKYNNHADFIHCLLDTLLFICERGSQIMVTGDPTMIFHSGDTYGNWITTAMELRGKKEFLNNVEAHEIDYYEYMNDLERIIDEGISILKYSSDKSHPFERRIVSKTLGELQLVKSNELTRKAALETRRAPLGVLIFGTSSVGKSTLADVLFNYHALICGLSTSPEFKYTRNPQDPYWPNFRTHQHTVHFDDIANVHPNKSNGLDETLKDVIQALNNTAFVPTQADLADKGRTPFRAKLVTASTNVENLNAHHYFSTPLAIQRRFPILLEVSVKPEYTKDGQFLDSTKVPKVAPGDYPNFWFIKVKKVAPAKDPRYATITILEEFSDIHNFLDWFGEQALMHHKVQDEVIRSVTQFQENTLCKECKRVTPRCVCGDFSLQSSLVDPSFSNYTRYAGEGVNLQFDMDSDFGLVFLDEWRTTFIAWCYMLLFMCIASVPFLPFILYKTGHIRQLTDKIMDSIMDPRLFRFVFRRFGRSVQRKIFDNRFFVRFVMLLTSVCLAMKCVSTVKRFVMKKKDEPIVSQPVTTISKFVDQGTQCSIGYESATPNILIAKPRDIGSSPVQTNSEKQNVWYKDSYVLSRFDVSKNSLSNSSMSEETFAEILAQNCFGIRILHSGRTKAIENRMLALGGHLYVTNNHAIPDREDLEMEITHNIGLEGVVEKTIIPLDDTTLFRDEDKDLAFVYIRKLPPNRSLWKFLPNASFSYKGRGMYVSRTCTGVVEKRQATAISKGVETLADTTLNVWLSRAKTEKGFCGSALFTVSPFGPVILGIHIAGSDVEDVAVTNALDIDYVRKMMLNLERFTYQSTAPLLDTPGYEKPLGPLHAKSPVRYVENGIAYVYGSFQGFRRKSKSKVCRTLICESMLKKGYTIKHCAPDMSSWKPWHLALKDMVNAPMQANESILQQCTASFISDILSELPQEELDLLHVYDMHTAINGADGIRFVDPINRSTSMGFPWSKTKRNFLVPLDDTKPLEKMDFLPEIKDRAYTIIDNYKEGYLANPIFTAHLKDEAVTLAKAAAGKTRVFAGAPADWSLVVRMYTLSFVRVLQRNKFVFEAAPGTIAQSAEWGEIRDYLTTFGEDRIVGGDFSKYDKRMLSIFILAAGDIIGAVCEKSGNYSHDDLKILHGLFEDMAFAWMDFNGTFMRFICVNPSGHPLTVIVNSLVNSLYMRYAYLTLNPNKECRTFRKNVKLMTYGDDNGQGVSARTPWYNHTSISSALEKIGVIYTMPDKESVSIAYMNINNFSFLKRTWRFDNDVGAYLCPLEHDSINKMLTVCVKSTSVSEEYQAVAVISTAVREYFYYGKTVFEEKTKMLKEVISENALEEYVCDSTFPTWDDLVYDFHHALD